jgi:hypothetical protein
MPPRPGISYLCHLHLIANSQSNPCRLKYNEVETLGQPELLIQLATGAPEQAITFQVIPNSRVKYRYDLLLPSEVASSTTLPSKVRGEVI